MKQVPQNRKARILLVDDHPIIRYGVSRILNKEDDLMVCGEAEDGNDALQTIEKLKPDVVLLDISLKRLDGLKLTKIIRLDYPLIRILVFSMHDEIQYARKALRSGAKGYLMKENSSEKIVSAIRQVLKGEIYVSEAVKKLVMAEFGTPQQEQTKSPVDKLSDRERQVFIMLGQGYSSRAMAERLILSVKTIETHRARIKLKLAIENNQDFLLSASTWAEREGLKPPLTI